MRGCHQEETQVTHAPQRPKPRKPAPKIDDAKPVDIDTWSRRFEEREAPPAKLVPDKAITRGTLDNGFRFILAPQVGGGEGLSLRLLVLAGSMHETDAERGYAHFVEHLAFMGRRSRRQGDTLAAFESFGASQGADTNAYTTRDHTLYRLDLSDSGGFDEAFDFFRDVADGLLFLPRDVDSERRIVLREMAEREKKDLFEFRAAAILPGVPAAGRAPIGLKETIERATPAALRDFWQRGYVPSRLVFCVAGDFDRGDMAEKIRHRFGSLKAREAMPDPEPGDPLAPRGADVVVVPHLAEDLVRITIAARQPLQPAVTDPGLARLQMVRALAGGMLGSRLRRDGSRHSLAGSPAENGDIGILPGIAWREVHAEAASRDALPVMEALLGDLLSARDRGFTELEFAEARGALRRTLRTNFSTRLSQANSSLGTLLVESARNGSVVESPEDELNRARTDLATITRADCENLLRDEWQDEGLRVVLSGSVPEGLERAATPILQRTLAAPRREAPKHPGVRQLPAESFGSPGVITRQELDADRGFVEAEFANGVLVRLQPMPSLGGAVSVAVDLGYGRLAAPMERPGMSYAADRLVDGHPLAGFDQLDFNAALADRELSSNFTVPGPFFRWRGDTDRDELAGQLELLAACVARSGVGTMSRTWRPNAQDRAQLDARIKAWPQVSWKMQELLDGGDPRVMGRTLDFMNCNGAMVTDWLTPILREGRLRVLIAGDFAPQQALAEVAASFGALPQRAAWDAPSPYPPLPETPAGKYVSGPDPDSKLGAAVAMLPLGVPHSVDEELETFLLRNSADRQIRSLVRSVRGKSYSVSAMIQRRSDEGGTWLLFSAPCDIKECDAVAGDIRDVIAGLGRGQGWYGFEGSCRLTGHYYRKRLRNPEQVLDLLATPATYPGPRDLEMGRLMALTPAVRALAARVMVPELAVELQTLPPE